MFDDRAFNRQRDELRGVLSEREWRARTARR
jgi:hypothetical protein